MRHDHITDPIFQQRFFSHMVRSASGCLAWTKAKDRQGYGLVKCDGKLHRTHRVAWSIAHGPIPDGLCVLHKCDNPVCCLVDHLFLGTDADNNHDMRAKGRAVYMRGECQGCAKLTESDVLEIRRVYVPGSREFGTHALARRFGVVQATIWRALHRTAWQHI